ncbi:MAG: universal stress protein [Actinomycetota bacterium]|nr:universal stress protein [Actinomycetota bacterium]
MSKHIIVGVDDSDTAAQAARVAADLAVKLGGELHVIMACDDERSTEVGVGSDLIVINRSDEAAAIAQGVAATLRRDGLVISSGARYGRPHEALIEEAKRFDDALIVVGNRRMTGAGRMLGSVANSVAHNAPCDVYVVKTT